MTPLPLIVSGSVDAGTATAREHGTPTANLTLATPLDIMHGVYVGYARVSTERLPALIFYGIPFSHPEIVAPRLEVHVLDREVDLYGAMISVELEKFIRPNERFDDHNSLQRAIDGDVQTARDYFKNIHHV